MALAPRIVQNMPDCFRRQPITVLQPPSITPEPMNSADGGTLGSAYARRCARSSPSRCESFPELRWELRVSVVVLPATRRVGTMAGVAAFGAVTVGFTTLAGSRGDGPAPEITDGPQAGGADRSFGLPTGAKSRSLWPSFLIVWQR